MEINSDAETIIAQARQLPPGERAQFLLTACAGDPSLLMAVEATLAESRAAGDLASAAPAGSSREKAGTMMGRYRLIEPLGEGGMGSVWMAEQREPIVRRVALKIIKLGMDTQEVVARFEQERQALALMDHPCIAKVFDAGATDGGRPYFVMELVSGVSLTTFCNEQRLGVRERLALFIQVCQAIQHAHQKGIIHRDIKPSNIIACKSDDGQPLPKVIDFGIAKATGPALTGGTVLTQFAQVIGTPAYMSPEQAGLGSMDIDTRSDIYSLGVLLYELLTGRPPFDPRKLISAGLEEMRRIIREEEPPRPSTRISSLAEQERTGLAAQRNATTARVATAVRGDLDWIVMKALEKDRSRRYETVGALVSDIHRHLQHQPVLARPPGSLYLLSRFVRRHKIGFTAGTGSVLALLGGITAATWGFMKAEAERDKARHARGTAEGLINSMLYGLRDKLQPVGRLDLLDDVSLQAEKYFEDMPAEDITPQVLREKASMLTNRESVLVVQGKLPATRAVYATALTIMEELASTDAVNPDWQQHLSFCHERVGSTARAAGDLPAARAATGRALAISGRLAVSFPTNTVISHGLAETWDQMGSIEEAGGNLTAARAAFEKALAIREGLAQGDPANAKWQRSLAVSHHRLAFLAKSGADLKGAAAAFDKAQIILEHLAQSDPGNASAQWDVAVGYSNAGEVAQAAGDSEAAGRAYSGALAIAKKLVRDDPDNADWQRHLSVSYERVGTLASSGGDLKGAREAMNKALAIRERLCATDPFNSNWQSDLAICCNQSAQLAMDGSDLKAADALLEKSVRIMERLAQKEPAHLDRSHVLSISYTLTGDVALRHRNSDAARTAFAKALGIRERLASSDPENTHWQSYLSESQMRAGDMERAAGNRAAARESYQKALTIRERLAQKDAANTDAQRDLLLACDALGRLAGEEGDHEAERTACEKIIAISERLAAGDPSNADRQHDWYISCLRLYEVEKAAGNDASARRHRKQAFEILKAMKARGATLDAAAMLFLLKESLRGE